MNATPPSRRHSLELFALLFCLALGAVLIYLLNKRPSAQSSPPSTIVSVSVRSDDTAPPSDQEAISPSDLAILAIGYSFCAVLVLFYAYAAFKFFVRGDNIFKGFVRPPEATEGLARRRGTEAPPNEGSDGTGHLQFANAHESFVMQRGNVVRR